MLGPFKVAGKDGKVRTNHQISCREHALIPAKLTYKLYKNGTTANVEICV